VPESATVNVQQQGVVLLQRIVEDVDGEVAPVRAVPSTWKTVGTNKEPGARPT
jgi:hypothetical protein